MLDKMYGKYLFKIAEKSAVPIRLTPSHILVSSAGDSSVKKTG